VTGAESLVETLLASGVNTCFANPGTSEMHFVSALDRIPGIRCVLCVAEGVASGAADGFARMAEAPAATLLHCGPGLANALANLHNARRANSPVINIVGDHATYHRPLDPPLVADTEGWARGVSAWVRTANSAATVGTDAAGAVQAARTSPGHIASLIVPSDVAWNERGHAASPLPVPATPKVSPATIKQIAAILRCGEPSLLLLGGAGVRGKCVTLACKIAGFTKSRLLAQQYNARYERGRGQYAIGRIPYAVDDAVALLADIKHLVLIGAASPIAFFAYPGKPSHIQSRDCVVHVMARPEHDIFDALSGLAEELGVPSSPGGIGETARPEPARGPITPDSVGQSLAALLPENAIVVDEGVTFGRSFFSALATANPHDWLPITGGSIGIGLPLAAGAAIASPDRRIVVLQADGSALYTVQALWTHARERSNITTIILSNRKYAILIGELARVGANPGRTALDMLDLSRPDLDWVKIAEGMGVEAARADKLETFNELFRRANNTDGPFLIELVIP
jgi:acetolactate synthase I/II/III large subunit